ncbi:hypothetical protein C8J57DRAFT_1621210 [Mycena rebaudengoi]|nr:hypothetical protein C8J57DRAFT_1621210 [Mycena rebaudengoi]
MFFSRAVIALVGLTSMTSALVVRTDANGPNPTPTSTLTSTAAPTGEFLTTKFSTIAGHTDAHATVPSRTITLVLPTCIQTEIPDKNGFVPPGTCHALCNFSPAFAAAVLFSVLFHYVPQPPRHSCAYVSTFCWVLIMACFWEFSAFVTCGIGVDYPDPGLDGAALAFSGYQLALRDNIRYAGCGVLCRLANWGNPRWVDCPGIRGLQGDPLL